MTDEPAQRGLAHRAMNALVGGALGYYAPATAVLATWLAEPPETVPGWCRWRGPATRRQVALTFDDGPSPDSTERTLDILDATGMRATFFLIGEVAVAHPDLVGEILRRGHGIGNHGQRHRHHLLHSPAWIRRDLARSVEVLTELTGRPPRFYRPSYGQLTFQTLVECRRQGMELVLWTRWGKEFADHDESRVVDRVASGAIPGSILLLHDTDVSCPPGTAARTHRLLHQVADVLSHRDLKTVTLDELVPTDPPGGR